MNSEGKGMGLKFLFSLVANGSIATYGLPMGLTLPDFRNSP